MVLGEEMQRRNANTRGRVGSKLSDREAIIYNHGTLVLPLVHKEMSHQPGTLPPSSSSRASKRVVFWQHILHMKIQRLQLPIKCALHGKLAHQPTIQPSILGGRTTFSHRDLTRNEIAGVAVLNSWQPGGGTYKVGDTNSSRAKQLGGSEWQAFQRLAKEDGGVIHL